MKCDPDYVVEKLGNPSTNPSSYCQCEPWKHGERCLTGGWKAGGHVYNIHVTRYTFKCACHAVMGRTSSSAPDGVDTWGECPARAGVSVSTPTVEPARSVLKMEED